MDVILLERIEKLGQMGDVVTVKPGFARNYLLPQKKALRATQNNRDSFEVQRAQLEADNLKRRGDAAAAAEKIDDVSIIVIRQAGESGNLYGSVTARDVAKQLTADGYTVDKRQVTIDRPIKELGLHDVRVALHPEVAVTVIVNVAKSDDEARIQAAAGGRGEEAATIGEVEAEAAGKAPSVEELFENPEQAISELEAQEAEAEAAEADDGPAADGAAATRDAATRDAAIEDTVEVSEAEEPDEQKD